MSIVEDVLGLMVAVLLAAVGELVSDEIRARLDRIPLGILTMASKRLPPEQRKTVYAEAWLPELRHILQGDEATPITRLIHGIGFAGSLWLSAPKVGRELAADPEFAGSVDTTWASLFPYGRDIFYEGKDPGGFVRQIQAEFGFSPALDPRWGEQIEDETHSFDSYCFYCPAEHLDAIYGNDRFPMGS
jgi:hypothetical protein